MIDDIRAYAREVLMQEGFAVDLPPDVSPVPDPTDPTDPTDAIQANQAANAIGGDRSGAIRDLRHLPWSSIDNVTTRDVDQLEQSELVDEGTLVRVAIADVDAYVRKDSAIDARAAQNTVSVYGGDVVLPMLPRELSEGLTSLLAGQDRLALVAEFVVTADGSLRDETVYRALVHNYAQLDYDSLNAWLAGSGPLPSRAVEAGLEDQLRMQHEAAVRLHALRISRGALEFERRELRPVMKDGEVVDIEVTQRGAARDLIEDFMIAANAVIAGCLESHDVSWIRRMVGDPERWPSIVAIGAEHGVTLPPEPDRIALGTFLREQKARDPARFPELSLSILRLLGSGAYMVEHRSEDLDAHFALGVDDYTHFTAPNRRFADVVTQRIVKAVLSGDACPYSDAELEAIAKHCTEMEDKAHAVERRIGRRMSASLMRDRVGATFDATIVAVDKSRVSAVLDSPAVEGRIAGGDASARVGERIRVKVASVDVEKGHIEFEVAQT